MTEEAPVRRSRSLWWKLALAVGVSWLAATYQSRPHPKIEKTVVLGATNVPAGGAFMVQLFDNIPNWCIGWTARHVDMGPDVPAGYLPSDPMPDDRPFPIPIPRSDPPGCGPIVIRRSMFGCGIAATLFAWQPVVSRTERVCILPPST